MSDFFRISAQLAIFGILTLLIFSKPYFGVILTITSLPVTDILPPISMLTSILPLIGGVTLAGFLFSRRGVRKSPFFQFGPIQYLGLLFVLWIFITNPLAAWFGVSRNWVLTFVQLWILAWLAGELLDTPQKQHTLMGIFAGVTTISALIAIQQGQIGASVETAIRAGGLAGGANSAVRYFVVALVFLVYLRSLAITGLKRLIASTGIIILTLGIFMTGSRTGILLTFGAAGMLAALPSRGRRQIQIFVLLGAGLLALWYFSDSILNILRGIIPSIAGGTDTVGLRYGFWQAGIRMWLDHILSGVGIGMYPEMLADYGWDLVPSQLFHATPHNMYIALLAETGIVGLGIFILIIGYAFHGYASAKQKRYEKFDLLINFWIIVFVVLLLGGITKTDQADKLLWLVFGLSSYFYRNNSFLDSENGGALRP